MSGWDADELAALARVEEVRIASPRSDESSRPAVIIWVVVAGDGVYVRSARGPSGGWFRHLVAAGTGTLTGRGIDRAIVARPARLDEQTAVDAAYREKYGARYASIVAGIVGPDWYDVTLRLDPVE